MSYLVVVKRMREMKPGIKFFYCITFFLSLALWHSCNPVTERMEGFGVHGIDVSHYQKRIDWNLVEDQPLDFVFVKATEGLSYKDSLFCRNWTELNNRNLIKGAYHFYYPQLDPVLQAQNFIETVELQKGDLPPVLDFEVVQRQSKKEIVKGLKEWSTEIEEAYDIKPIIYTNLKMYNKYIKGDFDGYKVWIARYNDIAPDMPFNQGWDFWQYGNRGRVEGIEGDVDLNVFHGSLDDLQDYTLGDSEVNDTLTDIKYPL